MFDPNALKIYIDGSAYKREGGLAVAVEYPEDCNEETKIVLSKKYKGATNNRMELRACIEALKWANKNVDPARIGRVIIFTDSLYVCDNQNNAYYWKKGRNRYNRPMKNFDLWKEYISNKRKIRVHIDIKWYKGKSSEITKLVDRAAKSAAKSSVAMKDYGYSPGKVARTKIKSLDAPVLFPAYGEEEIIRIYKKNLAGKEEYEIVFELYSKKTKSLVDKYFAYAPKERMIHLHRAHYYKVQFNSDRNYPIIKAIKEFNFFPNEEKTYS